MDDLVQINNNKENILEFELSTSNNIKDINAAFVIRSTDMDLAFVCERTEGNKWRVKLPPLTMLERTTYPFRFQVIADGYHFEPLKGAINVVGSNEVYVTQPKNKLSAPIDPTASAEPPKVAKPTYVPERAKPTRSREKSIAQLAEELTGKKKPEINDTKKTNTVEKIVETPIVEPKKSSRKSQRIPSLAKIVEDTLTIPGSTSTSVEPSTLPVDSKSAEPTTSVDDKVAQTLVISEQKPVPKVPVVEHKPTPVVTQKATESKIIESTPDSSTSPILQKPIEFKVLDGKIKDKIVERSKHKTETTKPVEPKVLSETTVFAPLPEPAHLLPVITLEKREETKTSEADAKVRAILDEAGMKTKKRFSILPKKK